jgi:ABC-2 type transport system ATP-binding protein
VCIISRGEKVLDGLLADIKGGQGGQHVALALESGDGVSAVFHDKTLVKRVDDSNRFFEIELAEGADPQTLLRRIVEAGARVQRFELVQPSLHQIFLERVGASGIEDGLTGQG